MKTNNKIAVATLLLCGGLLVGGFSGLNNEIANVAAEDTSVFEVKSVSLRIPDATYGEGMRFTIVMDKDTYTAENVANLTTGLLVIPEYALGDEELTVDLQNATLMNVQNVSWTESDDGTMMQIYLHLYGVPADQYTTDVCVRAYVDDANDATAPIYTDVATSSVAKTADWLYDNDTTLDEDEKATLKATYLTYDVFFHNDANVTESMGVYGEKIDAPTAPEKEGYTFGGWWNKNQTAEWDFASTTVSGATNLYAKWDVVTYTAKVVRADGSEETVAFTIEDRAEKLAEIALTANNAQYTYSWESALPTELALNNEQVFTETRVENTYTVSFNTDGGTAVGAQTVPYGTDASALAYFTSTKKGYIFGGWTLEDGTAIPSGATVTSNITVKAKWSPIEYYIEYNGNGATSGSMATDRFAYGEETALTINGFEKTNHVFLGWSLDQNATTATYTDGQAILNLTEVDDTTLIFYAVWEKEEGIFTAELDYNGGKDTAGNTSSIIEFKVDAISYPTVTNGNQMFYGWTEDPTTNALFDYTKATGNVKLYAVWVNMDYSSANDADLLTVGNYNTSAYTLHGIVADPLASDGYALKIQAGTSSWRDFWLNIGNHNVNKNSMLTINVRSNSKAVCFFPNVGGGGSISNKITTYSGTYYYAFNIIGFNDNEVLNSIKIQMSDSNGAEIYIDSIVISTIDTTKDFALSTIDTKNYADTYIAGKLGTAGNDAAYNKSYLSTYEGKDNVLKVTRSVNNNAWVDMNAVFTMNYRANELETLKALGYKTLKFSFRTDNGGFTTIYNGVGGTMPFTTTAFEKNKWIDVEIALDDIIANYSNITSTGTKFMYFGFGNYSGKVRDTNFYFTGVTLSK